jgi:hypothetical protein
MSLGGIGTMDTVAMVASTTSTVRRASCLSSVAARPKEADSTESVRASHAAAQHNTCDDVALPSVVIATLVTRCSHHKQRTAGTGRF